MVSFHGEPGPVNVSLIVFVTVANKAFPKKQPVLDFLKTELGVQNFSNPLERFVEIKLRKFLKGLKVEYRMPSREPSGHTKRTYKVDDIGPSPRQHRYARLEDLCFSISTDIAMLFLDSNLIRTAPVERSPLRNISVVKKTSL